MFQSFCVFHYLLAGSFHKNPQVYAVLRDIRTDDDALSSCLVALMHKELDRGKICFLYLHYKSMKDLLYIIFSRGPLAVLVRPSVHLYAPAHLSVTIAPPRNLG